MIAEYYYSGLRPVAVKTNGVLYAVHTDYLGTPRLVTTAANGGNIVWQWKNDNPYGNNKAEGNIEFNLRFAGQYYDVESNLHYNMNRTYNPETGRYLQSDPIGLAGGFNTYNYVNKNPLDGVDPLGLNSRDVSKIMATFINTENSMVQNHQKIPGDNSKDDNNARAYYCNPAFSRKGDGFWITLFDSVVGTFYPCDDTDKSKNICYGQSRILQSNLEKLIPLFEDKWQIIQQNGDNHDWVVMYSNNSNDPILYLDPWAYQVTKNKPCDHCETKNLSPTDTDLYSKIYLWRKK